MPIASGEWYWYVCSCGSWEWRYIDGQRGWLSYRYTCSKKGELLNVISKHYRIVMLIQWVYDNSNFAMVSHLWSQKCILNNSLVMSYDGGGWVSYILQSVRENRVYNTETFG